MERGSKGTVSPNAPVGNRRRLRRSPCPAAAIHSVPFRWYDSSPEVIRLVVLVYVRYPLTLDTRACQPSTCRASGIASTAAEQDIRHLCVG